MSIWLIILIIFVMVVSLGIGIWATTNKRKNNFNELSDDEEKPGEEIIDRDELINLSFDKTTNRLVFKIQHYHSEPKISRYVQRNYQRFPVYEGEYSVRTKVIKNFNKIINPIKFVNEDILNLGLERQFILEIIEEIGKIPGWRKKEIKIKTLKNKIEDLNSAMRSYSQEMKEYKFKSTDYEETASNFWKSFFLVPLTLGFSFKGYVSKKQAEVNIQWNQENKIWNEKHKLKVDRENWKLKAEIEQENQQRIEQIKVLEQNLQRVENQEIKYEKEYEKGWLDLKDASNAYYAKLANQKGVYIIWNKTKNKYYVGQSKNLKTRLMNHFKDAEPKNIIFAKDWYDGDLFVYKYYICETKDELDVLEKRYIEEYSSFETGYNKTRGNI